MESFTKAIRERMNHQRNVGAHVHSSIPQHLQLSRLVKLAKVMQNIRTHEASQNMGKKQTHMNTSRTKTGVMMTHNSSTRSIPLSERNCHFFYKQETNHRAIRNRLSYQGSQTIVAILELPVYLKSEKNPTPPQLAFFQKDGQFFDRMTLVEIDDTTIKNEGNSMTKHTALFAQYDKDSSQEKKYSIKIDDIYCISSAAADNVEDIST
jgi:hypothetical protein